MATGGGPPPPTGAAIASLLLLLLGRLLLLRHRGFTPLPVAISGRERLSDVVASIANRYAAQELGLRGAVRLVMHEVGVELRQADHLQARLLEHAVEHAGVVGRQQVQRAVGLRGRPQPEHGRHRRRVALDVAKEPAEPRLRRHQRQARAQRERVPASLRGGRAGDVGHQLAVHALRHEVRRDLVRAVRVGLAPRLEQISRLAQVDALRLVPLDPAKVLEPAHHVVRVAEADLRAPRQLLQTPRALRLGQQDAHHAGGARREERAQGPRRGPRVALALLLDEDLVECEVAVAGEIDVAEAVVLEDARALRADVDGGSYGIGRGQLAADLGQPRDGRPDLPGLTERADFNDHELLRVAQAKFHRYVDGFAGSPQVGEFLPGLRPREELPQALGRLSPNLSGFQHLPLVPALSASAETIRTVERPCQDKTCAPGVEDHAGWCRGCVPEPGAAVDVLRAARRALTAPG